MHVIGDNVIEQALIMRDEKNAEIRAAERVDAVRDDFQRVDIEAAVGFVEHGVFRIEHCELKNFVPLFFAAGETFVDRTRGE